MHTGCFCTHYYHFCLFDVNLLGGWTLSDNFPALSADPVTRDAFAQKCAELVAYHDFDGVDIDWEVSYIRCPSSQISVTIIGC